MDKDKILSSGLLEQYVLGLTSPEESEAVERYAQLYPEVREKLEHIQASFDEYMAEQDIPPAPMRRMALPPPPKKRIGIWPILALVLFCVSSFFFHQNRQIQHRYEHLHHECMEARAKCEHTGREQQRTIAFLNDPKTMPVILRGTDACPRGVALAYWNPERRAAYLHIVDMPAPPLGHQYQIWADVAGVMLPIGLLKHHHDLQAIDFQEQAVSLNVTIEPEGGSHHPNVARLVLNGEVMGVEL